MKNTSEWGRTMLPIRVPEDVKKVITDQARAEKRSASQHTAYLLELGLRAYERQQKAIAEADV